jgi:hypothetical protein
VGLGGKAPIPATAGDDAAPGGRAKRLFRLSDSSGTMVFSEVSDVSKTSLDSSDVFLFDSGIIVYVWVGKGASNDEIKGGMGYATQYLVDNSISMSTSCVCIREGSKVAEFEKLLA